MYDSEKDDVFDAKQGYAKHKCVGWAVDMVDENEDAEHLCQYKYTSFKVNLKLFPHFKFSASDHYSSN